MGGLVLGNVRTGETRINDWVASWRGRREAGGEARNLKAGPGVLPGLTARCEPSQH